MKKSEIFGIGLEYGLTKQQIESVVCNVLSIDSKQYFLLEDFEDQFLYPIQKAFYKLQGKEPEEYVYKKAEFYGNDFYVDERVLIPRNETEILVHQALKEINIAARGDETTLIDVGTGSSCIPVSVALALKPLKLAHIYALDISPEALEVARMNIEKHHLESNITRVTSSLLGQFVNEGGYNVSPYVIITANLPYIKEDDYKFMHESVIKFEPDLALFGGNKTGFEFYEDLIKQCYSFKKIYSVKEITLFIEIGFDQAEISRKFLSELGLRFEYFQDSNRIERIIKITGF